MQIGNTTRAYGWAAIALHWISAVGMIWLFIVGESMENVTDKAAKSAILAQHVSLGACFFLFMLGRVIWSYTQPKPAPLTPNKWLDLLATAIKHAFLLLILILIISGPITVWSKGYPIQVFDWFAIPGPFATENHDIHELAEKIHIYAHVPLVPLLALHILGSLYHLVIARDRTLLRMLWVRKDH